MQSKNVNLEAEVATLGAMLTQAGAAKVAMRFLSAKDFTTPKHRKIFRLFEQVDPEYLVRLQSAVPTSANPEFYARIVKAMSDHRREEH